MSDQLSSDGERDEPSTSTINISSLPFGVGPYGLTAGKTLLGSGPSAVAMFYPQISGYEIHPLILSQRQRSGLDKDDIGSDDSSAVGLVANEHTVATLPASLRHLYKDTSLCDIPVAQKQRKRKAPERALSPLPDDESDDLFMNSDLAGSSRQTEPSDYSTKSARKSFYCRACGKCFKFQTSLLRHNNKVHISKYQCPTCHRVFSRQAYLDVHTSKQGSSCYIGSYGPLQAGNKSTSSRSLSLGVGLKYEKFKSK